MNILVLGIFIVNIGCNAYDQKNVFLSDSLVNEGEPVTILCDISLMNLSTQEREQLNIEMINLKKFQTSGEPKRLATLHTTGRKWVFVPESKKWNFTMERIKKFTKYHLKIVATFFTSFEDSGIYLCLINTLNINTYVEYDFQINGSLVVRHQKNVLLSESLVNEGEPVTILCAISLMNLSTQEREQLQIYIIDLKKFQTSGEPKRLATYATTGGKWVHVPQSKKWNFTMEGMEKKSRNYHAQIVATFFTSIEDSGIYLCLINTLNIITYAEYNFQINGSLVVRGTTNHLGASSFGKRFHLAFPELYSEVFCSMYTKEFKSFKVTLTTAWYSKEVKPVIYMLENSHPTNATLVLPFSTQNVYQLRFTYILDAEYEFQMMCYSLNSRRVPNSVMVAVPVKGFGRVFVLPSIPFQPSVQVISGEEDLSVSVEISYTTKDGKQLKSFLTQKDSKGIIHLIRRYNSLSVELCKYKDNNAQVTGAMLKGSTHFGAIIGSCIVEPRLNTTDECPPDFDFDMLIPVTEYFKLFIVALPLKVEANVVLSFTGVTEVVVNNERKEDSGSSEMSRDLGVFRGIHIITVSRASYVTVVLNSPCPADKQRNWKVMFNSILPRSLFVDVYLWETVFYKSHEQYIVVIYKMPNQLFILLDGVSIHRTLGPEKYNETVRQRLYFSSVQIESRPGRHQLYSVNAHKFGAYLYGSETQEQTQLFMTPLGFVSQPAVRWGKFEGGTTEEEKCDAESRGNKVAEGDFIDNDCDFLVDEEMKDGKDNDQDGKIDEDITLPFPRNGEWSSWEQWQCESIDGTLKNRSRSCTNPAPTKGGYDCEGPSAQSKTGNCQHVIKGIVDGEMVNVAVECLCDETLGNLSMAKLKRDCIPPPSAQGEPCVGNKDIVGPEDSCQKSCLKKEICVFERNSSLATQVTSEYAGENVYVGLEECRRACQSQANCQGFTVSIRNKSSPNCWLFHRLIFGKENAAYESYIQRCTMVCEHGYYSREYNMRDYTTCNKCPKGTYKNFTSSGSCLLCPTHWTTLFTGSTSIKDCDIVFCAPGYFLNVDRKCQPCQLGTYKNVQGNEACLPCPGGKMTATVGTTDQASCIITVSPNQTKPSPVTGLTKASKTTNTSLNTFTVDPKLTLIFTSFVTMTQRKQYAGNWGGWSKWSCVENCTVKSFIRTRHCLDPPEGPRDFDCPGFGYQLDKGKACNTICSTTCPNGQWGFNCTKTCPNCETRCEKDTGICNRCKPGFRDPLMSCTEACEEMTFGFNCTGNCAKKCQGKDCVERATGTCPSKSMWDNAWWYAALVLLIIPIIVACKISGRVARHQYEVAEAKELKELYKTTEEVENEIPKAISEPIVYEKEVDSSAGTEV